MSGYYYFKGEEEAGYWKLYLVLEDLLSGPKGGYSWTAWKEKTGKATLIKIDMMLVVFISHLTQILVWWVSYHVSGEGNCQTLGSYCQK